MVKEEELTRKFETVFEVRQAVVLAEAITEAYTDLVKTSDFNELKAIVKDLAEAQNRTELRMEELAEAQNRTELRMEKLAETMDELAESQKDLALGLRDSRSEVGGLSRSMSYALENEAYRALPAFLKAQYGIELSERLIRTDIGGEEINFFGRAICNGETVLLVGETKLRLDERRRSRKEEQKVLTTLDQKIAAVRTEYPKEKIVPLLVTHYARQAFAQKIRAQGIILVQSFEW
jgi:hypothetical protein